MKRWIRSILVLICAQQGFAAEFQFNAYVDKNEVPLEGYFKYTVELSGPVGSMPSPQMPDFSDFYILTGPSESTNIQFVNGRMSASKTISCHLQPKRTGEITIPPARVKFKKKQYQTDPITIKVGSSRGSGQSGGDPDRNAKRDNAKGSRADIFLRVEPDKTTLVQNDAVIVKYRLYFRVSINSYEIAKLPQTPGFWVEEFKLPRQPVVGTEIIDGRRYQAAAIRKIALFPTKSGSMTVEPLEIQCRVQERKKSRYGDPFSRFFNDPFFDNIVTVPRYIQSEPLELKVLPFPGKGKPEDFAGAVGHFRMEVSLDEDSVLTNEPITLTVKIRGRGNIKMLTAPIIDFPPDFEKYDPEIDIKTDKSTGVVSGSKTFKYILVPRFPGVQVIEPVRFSFYNPRKKKYETLQSREFSVQVIRGKEMIMPGGVSVSPGEVTLYGQDIHFIKGDVNLKPIGNIIYRSPGYYLAFAVPLLLLAGGGVVRSYYLRLNPYKVRAKNAYRTARAAVEKAGRTGVSDRTEDFFRGIGEGLRGYIADKTGTSSAGLVLDEIKEELGQSVVSDDTIEEFFGVIQECDMGRFSPVMPDTPERAKLIKRAMGVLSKIEEEWRG